ncbi:hypothetical protein B5X24_HaOG205175 [Helicoverpa armigera]|uniref:Uncharacterized protein n=1 Tax=Helicoverpa armigera TaxID=29058 RepID=A0A2W1BSD2_HELAM|nr:hypothetical protein B5X24_HaOG205175 [Helicoverpa armigera]
MRAAAAEEGIEFAEAAPQTQDTLWLDENGFVTSLDSIFGHHKYTTHAHKLFQLLDGFSSGKVWWRQLINRLVAVGAKKTSTRAEAWTPLTEQDIQRLEHCKRETLVKLVCVEREESFCYVAVSRGGRVGVYSGDMRLLHSYEMFYHRSGFHGRVKNRWITDAIYLPDVQFLMMSASDRSLTVYDAETLTHTPLYCITGLPNIPTCLAYTPSSHSCDTSELAFGTERADVTLVRFLQPKVQLLHTKTPDAINYYFWMELPSPPHSSYCAITRWRRVHSRSVKRVAYSRGGVILVSCSHDASTIKIKFPFLGVLGKKVEFGPYCIHPGPARKEDDEEELPVDEPIILSRRGSSVYQGSTGGLMLQLDSQNDWDKKGLEDEPECKRYNRSEVLVSCCDSVCRLQLSAPMNNAVSAGAPYLALRTFDPMTVQPVDEMMDEYKRVMRLFPDASITGTPTGSEMTTPRHSKSHRL